MAAALQVIMHTPALAAFVTNPMNLHNRSDFKQLLVVAMLHHVAGELWSADGGHCVAANHLNMVRDKLIQIQMIEASSRKREEDAGEFIMKILGIFDERNVPGLASLRTDTYVGECQKVRVLESMFRDYGVVEIYGAEDPAVNRTTHDDPPGVPFVHLDRDATGQLENALLSVEVDEEMMQGDRRRTCFGMWDNEVPPAPVRPPCCRLVKRRWAMGGGDLVMFVVDRHYYANGVYRKSKTALDLDRDGTIELVVAVGAMGRKRVRYRLSACTHYGGSSLTGHWVAYALVRRAARDAREWFMFNDATVSSQSPRKAVRACSEAGTFFVFEKVGAPRAINLAEVLARNRQMLMESYLAATPKISTTYRPIAASLWAIPEEE